MTDITTDDIEEQIFKSRLAGRSIRHLAKQFKLTVPEVSEIVTRLCAPVGPEMRRQALALDLERIEALGQIFYDKAMSGAEGAESAASILIRLFEHRSALLGLSVPASARGDAVQMAIITPPQPETSTDRIRRALADLAAGRLPPPSNGHDGEPER